MFSKAQLSMQEKFNHFHSVAIVLISLAISLLITFSVGWTQVNHDLSSFLAPVSLNLEGKSGLYSSFFDIKPPILLYSLMVWVALFGASTLSMIALNAFLLCAMFLLAWQVIRAFGSRYSNAAWGVFVIWSITSSAFSSMLVTSELVGNVFALGAIYLALRSKVRLTTLQIASSGALAAMATLSKEVYVFVALFVVAVPLIRREERSLKKALIAAAGGIVAGILVVAALIASSEFQAYMEVMRLKSELFPSPSFSAIFATLFSFVGQISNALTPMAALLAAAFPFVFLWQPLAKSKRNLQNSSLDFLGLMLFAAAIIALVWQAKPMYGHYVATLLIPLTVVVARLFDKLPDLFSRWPLRNVKLLIGGILTSVTIFSSPAVGAVVATAEKSMEKVTGDYQGEIRISADNLAMYKQAVEGHSCLQVAYGWSPGTMYMAADLPPCNRYFLVNIILSSGELLYEYQSELLAHPPRAVIYNPDGADLDVEQFESVVYPWKATLDHCYSKSDLQDLYLFAGSAQELRGCIAEIVKTN